MMQAGRQPAAPPPPPRSVRDDIGKDKLYHSPSATHKAKWVLLSLVVGTLAGALLGSIGSAALWTFEASRNGVPSFHSR